MARDVPPRPPHGAEGHAEVSPAPASATSWAVVGRARYRRLLGATAPGCRPTGAPGTLAQLLRQRLRRDDIPRAAGALAVGWGGSVALVSGSTIVGGTILRYAILSVAYGAVDVDDRRPALKGSHHRLRGGAVARYGLCGWQ